MIVNLVKSFGTIIWTLLKYPLIIVFTCLLFFSFLVIINVVYYFIKGYRFKKATSYTSVKKVGFLKKVLLLLPRQVAYDIVNHDPDIFPAQGLIIFSGRQGHGKTISLVKQLNDYRANYKKAKIITNLDYAYQDDELIHWKQLIDYNNGKFGVVCAIDETQNWFSSADSKNFPPEMLQVITQNRKNRRVILGTAQSFHLLAKSIRTQTTEVRDCHTFFGCLTVVFRKAPELDAEGNVISYKNLGSYFYVHNQELRDSYDTYKVISRLSQVGFNEKDKIYN